MRIIGFPSIIFNFDKYQNISGKWTVSGEELLSYMSEEGNIMKTYAFLNLKLIYVNIVM